MATRAESVSVHTLARSVEKAVAAAATRYELTIDKSTLLDRWEIIGRRLRGVRDMNVAFKFASEVASAIRLPGIRVNPVIGRIGRDILVGFIERGQLPKNINQR